MKRKSQNPREYSFGHTRDRLAERYNLHIDEADYEDLLAEIQERVVAAAMKRPSGLANVENQQMTFILPFKGREIAAVWDCNRALVTTVLPEKVVASYLRNSSFEPSCR